MSFKSNKSTVHPAISSVIIVFQFLALIYQSTNQITINLLLILLASITLEIIITKNTKNCLSLLRGILPFIIITFVVTILFAGPDKAFILILRIITGALIFSIFIITTNPTDFSKFLERMYIPTKLAIIPGISLSLIPRTLKDIEDTYNTIYLRGEIQGSFIKWLPKLLAISISSIVYRSSFIEESLVIKGFNSHQRRRNGPNHSSNRYDFFKILYWICAFSIILYYLHDPSLF